MEYLVAECDENAAATYEEDPVEDYPNKLKSTTSCGVASYL